MIDSDPIALSAVRPFVSADCEEDLEASSEVMEIERAAREALEYFQDNLEVETSAESLGPSGARQ